MHIKLTVILTLYAFIAVSQSAPLRFEKVEGLSQNTVYSILKDKQGFLWIATASGLKRYDGVETKLYKPVFGDIPGQMKGRIIRSTLLEDEHEQIWLATDLTINALNKKNQAFSQQQLCYKTPFLTAEDSGRIDMFASPVAKIDNTLWFATSAEGIFAVNTDKDQCSHYPLTSNVAAVNNRQLEFNGAYDGNNTFWFASNNGILSFNINTLQWKGFMHIGAFYSITMSEDTLYLGGNNRITWFNTISGKWGEVQKATPPGGISTGNIRCMITDDKNNIWAGDVEGNIYFKPEKGINFLWRGNINGNERTRYPVYCLNVDTTGILWIGADVLGLLKATIPHDQFKKFPETSGDGLSSKDLFIHAIHEDEEDNMWLGTFQNGMYKVNIATGKETPVKFLYYDSKITYGKSVTMISKDKKGNLWTSYSGYLYVKEKGFKDFQRIKIPIPENAFHSPQPTTIVDYKTGWLMGSNIGIYIITKENNTYRIRYMENYSQSKVVSIWEAPNGKLWIAPESGGLLIYNHPDDLLEEKRIFKGLNVKAIYYDEKRKLAWISTSDGLMAYHIPDGKYKLYTEQDGLPNNLVYAVIYSNNELWASTNYGLSNAKLSFHNGSGFPDITFFNYTVTDGLPDNEFNTGAFHKGESGTYYFGSTKGVVWFKPGDIKSTIHIPKLQLTGFMVNEKEADSLMAPEYIQSASLPYFKNNLIFKFRGIDFIRGKSVRYRYQLEGWDKAWIYSNTLNEVRYSRLPDGKYIFKIQAEGSQGQWTEVPKTVSIIIYPPFWKTWWFYSLSGLLMLTGIFLITKSITQRKLKKHIEALERQQELDKERQRISREMHDDIGAGLTQIAMISESIKNKTGVPGINELDAIAGTSRKLVGNMSEIIWSLNPEQKSLEQLCSYLREQLNNQLEYSGIAYSIQLPENGTDILLTNKQRRNILLITKEMVNNAIKYSKATHISIKAGMEKNGITFNVKDDGIGFDTSKIHSGNGLKNIRSRIEELDGSLKKETSQGNGTCFDFFIPFTSNT